MNRIPALVLAAALTLIAAAASADPGAPVLVNPDFECDAGVHVQPGLPGLVPNGWAARVLAGNPTLHSTRTYFLVECSEEVGFVERLSGRDSWVYLSEDIETPPEPGKPFDAALYQQVAVTTGVAYSLSGWMVSLCGGSATPNDCLPGYFMAKLAGLDPSGGADPLAEGVVWAEDRRNFVENGARVGWVNLRLAARADAPLLTIFARVRSPFRWHGNHAFVDAFSLVRAPAAQVTAIPVTPARAVEVRWQGDLGPDIAAIPGGTHRLLFDVQVRAGPGGAWADWLTDQPSGGAIYRAPGCAEDAYAFRVRPRAEQPPGSGGAWPNHRYPGLWSDPVEVELTSAACTYLPAIAR